MLVTNVRAFLGLIGYYQNYVKGYFQITMPLFDLSKKNVIFKWNHNCQDVFDLLKATLVSAPMFIWLDFLRAFILDVDWSTQGVGAILSQKEGRNEQVIAYSNKGLFHVQKKFHPMEGECYAPI